MAPTSASGSANPPTACVFAAPVNTDNGAEVVVFRLDVVVEVELELEDVIVKGEVEIDEVEVDEIEIDEVEVDEVEVDEVEVDGVEVGGGMVATVAVAPHSSRVSPFGQQPALVQ